MPSTLWKQQRYGEKWYAGETISVSIGQGQVSVTPMSMAVMMASVASGGRVAPRLVARHRRRTDAAWQPAAVTRPPAGRDRSSQRRSRPSTTGCGWR